MRRKKPLAYSGKLENSRKIRISCDTKGFCLKRAANLENDGQAGNCAAHAFFFQTAARRPVRRSE
jgi:hypothetical protein